MALVFLDVEGTLLPFGTPSLPELAVLDWPERSAEDAYFGLHAKTRAMAKWAAGLLESWLTRHG